MKSIINKLKFGGLALLLITAFSCEVTDLVPPDIITGELVFDSPERIESAVLGVYEAAQRGWYLGAVQRGYPFGAASIEQGDMRGEDMYNDQLLYEVTYIGSYTPQTANNVGQWESLYRLINRANVVLEGVESAVANGVIPQDVANGYIGEMYFIRALSHHELLINFCRPFMDNPASPGVPYRTFAVDDVSKVEAGIAVPRGTVAEDYAQVLSDLDLAEQFLSDGANSYRARRGAAIALKNRVRLFMGDWQDVVNEYNKISGLYSLLATPEGPFVNHNSAESIFALENSSVSNPGVNGALVNMYGDPALGGRGLVKISPIIWMQEFWLQEDLRRSQLAVQNPARGIFTNKYRAFGSFAEPTPLIRHAEIVLNTAEAYARIGNLDEAVALLNMVRNRAVTDPALYHSVASLGNQEGVITAILQERRIEFLAEGRRWPDIHRLSGEGRMQGVPLKAQSRSVTDISYYTGENPVSLSHDVPYTDHRFVWPIPLRELQTNPTLTQNDGW